MIKNYCIIAWRNLVRKKGYAAINIVGLALGMAIALLIALWIVEEVKFDHYYPNHSRLAQILLQQQPKGQEKYTGATVAAAIRTPLNNDYKSLFSRMAVTSFPFDVLIASGDKKLSRHTIWAEYTLPELFGFRMLSGSADALKDPSTILLSHSTAAGLFGKADPVNKTVRLGNIQDFKVGGVYEDQPDNTTFHEVEIILSTNNKGADWSRINDYDNHNCHLYVEMADKVTTDQATARIKNLPTPHIKNYLEELMVYPLDRMHLHDVFKNGVEEGGRIQYVRLFAIIGVFVLLLACINFMNLSTARSEQRAREVGIRKTMGSLRSQLIGQFIGESILTAAFSFCVALLLVKFSLGWFNEVSAKNIMMPWSSPSFWLLAIGFTLFTGILAGSYPAFYLSGFDAVKVLKGGFKAGRNARLPRQILVVTQFSVSLALIIGTLVIFRQIEVSKNRPAGYIRDGLIMVDVNTDDLSGHYDDLRRDILATGVAENMAESSFATTGFQENNDPEWEGQTAEQKSIEYYDVNVTPDFGKTVGWTILQGRDFSRDYKTDSSAILLNEEAVRVSGFKHPIGQIIRFFGKSRTVIGVVKNMLTNSPYEKIEPAIFLGDGGLGVITIRVKPDVPMRTTLARLEPVFRQHNPGSPFLYKFNGDEYAKKFETESRIGQLASVFASLAIFISCLGLFGLASFIAEQRTKEIGIRKVLGAGAFNLWRLLSRDFVLLVILSMFIAMPLGYWVMHQWLRNYEVQTNLSWWIFAAPGAGVLVITLLTVSYQALKAALMNPVRSLRSE